jgi:hypothetical protein
MRVVAVAGGQIRMNWRRGFFRAWVLISIIWAVGWSAFVLSNAEMERRVRFARMSNAELFEVACRTPDMPRGYFLDNEDCRN